MLQTCNCAFCGRTPEHNNKLAERRSFMIDWEAVCHTCYIVYMRNGRQRTAADEAAVASNKAMRALLTDGVSHSACQSTQVLVQAMEACINLWACSPCD